jgi:hypothetical protein
MYPTHEFLHVYELGISEEVVFLVVQEVRPVRDGAGEEGSMFGGGVNYSTIGVLVRRMLHLRAWPLR